MPFHETRAARAGLELTEIGLTLRAAGQAALADRIQAAADEVEDMSWDQALAAQILRNGRERCPDRHLGPKLASFAAYRQSRGTRPLFDIADKVGRTR